ncbi:conserved oligomeric Golgi complex subunit 1-like [Liolophura sinensis]|uniref:conserved oligomeric Golgi complex subunit 1-like n=1 Tax=Liolophura sinensis TaxID=3198878 RepID=UPI0031584AA4
MWVKFGRSANPYRAEGDKREITQLPILLCVIYFELFPLSIAWPFKMAASKTSKAAVEQDADLEANTLFEKHTIEEIRTLEKKARTDIERKKEDLRVMVGERYRDLIAAADTITEMKKISSNVMTSISNMEQLCMNLKQNYMVKGIAVPQRSKPELRKRKQEETQFYGIASQIKLLLDMPEKLWSAADSCDHLTATRLYLLSRHINTSLHLDSHQSSTILSWFPVLSRQWAAISHFKSTILQGCRQLLKQAHSSDKMIAEALCSIMLLEDSTPRQVFNEFLLARTTAVQQIFAQHNASVKEQLCTVVQLVSTTVNQIHAVFYSTQNNTEDNKVNSDLLLMTLEEVTSKSTEDSGLLDLHSSISTKYLPKTVTDFHPTLRAPATPVAVQHLHENCEQWVNTCVNDVKSGVGKLLNFVNSVKRLADIRDAVWQIQGQESLSSWDLVCQRVLRRPLSVWELFIRPLFLDRIKALVQYQCDTTLELTKRQMARFVMETADEDNRLMQQERDVSMYVWREMTGDIPTNSAWVPAGSKTLADGGGLMMKAKAFTPVVQSLCKGFDEKLKQMLEDDQHYLQADEQIDTNKGPFDRFSDDAQILSHVQSSVEGCINQLVTYVRQQLNLWGSALQQVQVADIQRVTCNKVLLVGRFCVALSELTPHFKKCVLGPSMRETQRALKKPVFTRSSSKTPDDPSWSKVKALLSDVSLDAYRIWTGTTAASLLKQFSEALNSENGRDVLIACTRWEEVEIQEETEDGTSVKSTIRVPMQASWHLQSLLCALCQEINRVGGHAISRSILQDIVNQISDGIIGCYERLLPDGKSGKFGETYLPFTQQRALQALFDVRFLLQIIPRKDDDKESKTYQKRAKAVISSLEELVDPFDLDVFSPFIQHHLSKQAHRSAVLLGALTSMDKHGTLTSSKQPIGSRQEQHNILPLTLSSSRFPLLPLSSQTPRSTFGQPILPHTTSKISKDMGSSLTAVAAATLPQQPQDSNSFYNKLGSMGQIWFSNIGSKS